MHSATCVLAVLLPFVATFSSASALNALVVRSHFHKHVDSPAEYLMDPIRKAYGILNLSMERGVASLKKSHFSLEQSDAFERNLQQLHSHRDDAVAHSKLLYRLAAVSHAAVTTDGTFQRDTAMELTSYHQAVLSFKSVLDEIVSYDKLPRRCVDEIRPLFGEVTVSAKYVLTAVDTSIRNIPILGTILGPIVYDIKNVLESVPRVFDNDAVDRLPLLVHRATYILCTVVSPQPTALCTVI